jgi:hypothetical protein
MLREHGALVILFVVIAIACAAYGWRALHAPARRAPVPAEPIYVEPIPDKDSP